jgi:threonine synthase
VSLTQEAQLTQFNGEATNVRACRAGSFDDCQRIVKAAFSHPELAARLTSANSINVGRWLPQMITTPMLLPNVPQGRCGDGADPMWRGL